jgi:malonate decarboxylase beta subunit
MSAARDDVAFINRRSFIELHARERASTLFDVGTARELLGPFDRVESPWLPLQGVTPQSDDGCVVMKGKIAGRAVVVVALEGAFQGGSLGEVSGAKLTAALDLARADSEQGIPTAAVMLLETGGPVISVVAGTVGCFGGMSLAAGLSSYIVMTREARLGLNGPEVIEQESGIDEFDSSDRSLIWAINGGEQRHAMGLADVLVDDDSEQIGGAIRQLIEQGVPTQHRSSQAAFYRERIRALDPSRQFDPKDLRATWHAGVLAEAGK